MAGKKEKIAILGLEVQGSTSAIDSESTRVAQDFTVALRTRPKAGQGPYLWTPGSEKELVDEKIMGNCPNEDKDCMAKIGSNLGADYLIYGKLERKSLGGQAGYQITLRLLRVPNASQLPGWQDFIPLGESQGTKLQDWARKGYKKLTNDYDGGTLRIKIRNENFDRGTILIDGEERGNITSGVGEVPSLAENRYKVSIVATGYDRWDSDEKITIRNGETTTEDVTLHKSKMVPGCDPAVSKDCGGTISDDGSAGTGKWKAVFVVGAVISAGGGAFGLYERSQKLKYEKGAECSKGDLCGEPDIPHVKSKGEHHNTLQTTGAVIAGVGGAIALVGLIKGFVLKGGKEQHASISRKHRTEVVVAPVVTDRGAGATLQLSW